MRIAVPLTNSNPRVSHAVWYMHQVATCMLSPMVLVRRLDAHNPAVPHQVSDHIGRPSIVTLGWHSLYARQAAPSGLPTRTIPPTERHCLANPRLAASESVRSSSVQSCAVGGPSSPHNLSPAVSRGPVARNPDIPEDSALRAVCGTWRSSSRKQGNLDRWSLEGMRLESASGNAGY